MNAETVADAMLRDPTVHPAGLTVDEARQCFRASPKTHLLLLVRDGVLLRAVTTDDLTEQVPGSDPVLAHGSLEDRTVGPDVPVGPLREAMAGTGVRRLAVVDSDMSLLGLLCLKKSLTGFCTDESVAAMRAARRSDSA